ncbi:hypothetical protein NDU88_005385 [Pleurodeles waltl]|uniref:Uncharacterized protein n=1 Tax=Pleurodeles waltl TaxID=8319 RepID=A0AAV7UIU1_PLEWA|nr:hypothetical protein NDU88_005385 [Pleurodeles waltl]
MPRLAPRWIIIVSSQHRRDIAQWGGGATQCHTRTWAPTQKRQLKKADWQTFLPPNGTLQHSITDMFSAPSPTAPHYFRPGIINGSFDCGGRLQQHGVCTANRECEEKTGRTSQPRVAGTTEAVAIILSGTGMSEETTVTEQDHLWDHACLSEAGPEAICLMGGTALNHILLQASVSSETPHLGAEADVMQSATSSPDIGDKLFSLTDDSDNSDNSEISGALSAEDNSLDCNVSRLADEPAAIIKCAQGGGSQRGKKGTCLEA